ncbi:MAG: AAA family ATPase [Desulfobacteraceae bacterium]|nr:AAA family ATPase [Desulfobacteraceae bacterium]MCF8095347.1 AAA family ATPase [Desulfobacteraceae bacterium]
MEPKNMTIPNPQEIEKEISDFLSKKYGNRVKVVSPIVVPENEAGGDDTGEARENHTVNFDLKPEELIGYLDQYVIRQEQAKRVLATKVCTHFNRIQHQEQSGNDDEFEGRIKNNIIMIGPTGVGKTYIIKLIAKKIGVPFVKADATKFSETGYVGGDVEDMVRDLVRESDNDIELAQYGIIYIDEIDKIAGSKQHYGADVSRSGVQRALLKPMEETEVELKTQNDPISMIQEVEQFRKTGKREKRSVNTKNILFIVSGAFSELPEIVRERTTDKTIGFGAKPGNNQDEATTLQQVKAEDIVEYGFESEFIGRLPVRSIFERLSQQDLFEILKNPNNPIILSKRLDFATYGIDVRFSDEALNLLAQRAYEENTGARGLVSVIEQALIPFETRLPTMNVKRFPVTAGIIENPQKALENWIPGENNTRLEEEFSRIAEENRSYLIDYIAKNRQNLSEQYGLPLSEYRIERIADYYWSNAVEIGTAINRIKTHYDMIKKIEINFYNRHDINLVLEEDAIDFISEQMANQSLNIDQVYRKIADDFEYGLKLIRDKTGKNRFFISKYALEQPETFLENLIKTEFARHNITPDLDEEPLLR